MRLTTCWAPLLLIAVAARARADVALLLGEPYGLFGALNPTGHAAVYLSGVCPASFTSLRPCAPGEPGVVISRYHRIAGYDWIALPPVPYFYAVERLEQIPESAGPALVRELRDRYRRASLRELAPDGPEGAVPAGNWIQLVGAAYDRRLYGFRVATTREQDEILIRELNSRPNRRRFNLIYRNCADFARGILDLYYPGAVRRSFIADAGITTPKQLAREIVKWSRKHPEAQLSAFVIEQVPGGVRRSRTARGVLESLVRTKKYVVPLAALHPWVAGSIAAAYLTRGRFNPGRCVDAVYAAGRLPAPMASQAVLSVAAAPESPATAERRQPGAEQSEGPRLGSGGGEGADHL